MLGSALNKDCDCGDSDCDSGECETKKKLLAEACIPRNEPSTELECIDSSVAGQQAAVHRNIDSYRVDSKWCGDCNVFQLLSALQSQSNVSDLIERERVNAHASVT